MTNLEDFVKYLLEEVNKSIYGWGCQGQLATEALINKTKNTYANKKAAIALLNKRILEGKTNIRVYDCSGLGMYYLQNMKHIYSSDMSANGIMGKCTLVSKTNLKKGMFVFRKNSTRAYHIGYVVDDALNIVHDKSSKSGVVKETLNQNGSSYWNRFGYLPCFADDIFATNNDNIVTMTPVYAGLIKLIKPYMRGDNVKAIQQALVNTGYSVGSIDGVYGSNTQKAVKEYQKDKRLTVDGVVGRQTWGALFDNNVAVSPSIVYTRLIKNNGKPYMKGEDIEAVQKALKVAGFDCGIVDGVYGANTENAVKAYQKKNNLEVDGIVGPNTFKKLIG